MMDNLLLYLLKVAAGSALFCISYLIFFRKDTFYLRNRVILILSIFIPVIVPLLTFTVNVDAPQQTLTVPDMSGFTESNSPSVASGNTAKTSSLTIFSLIRPLAWLYFAGIVIMVIRGLISLLSTYNIIRRGVIISEKFPKVIISEKNHPPFSFFPYAVIPVSEYNRGNYNDILDHETAHLRQRHTFDLLLSEMFIAFQWFNPFAWLLKRYMVLNHEYMADHVSLSNRSIKDYQYRLLSIAGAPKTVALTHTFNSELKNRIIMINTKPTTRKAAWKTLIIIPAVIGLSYAFVEPEYKYVITEKEPLTISEAPLIIQKGVKGVVLNEEGKPFQGVRLSNSKIPDEAFSVITGPDGRFSLGNIQPDESIMVFKLGYKRILLKPDFNADMTIRMEKDPQSSTMPIYSNKQGDAKLPQLVVIDGVISDKDFFTASKDLGYDFGISKMISGKEATDKYGEKGAVGVYEITTRKKAIEMGLRPPVRRLEPSDFPTFQNQQFTLFTDWVAQNAIYPEEARNKNLEGWVSVNFKVQLDGSVTDVLSNSGSVNPLLSDEIIRVIKNSPRWDSPKNPVIDEPFASNTIIRFRLPDQILNETPYVVVEQMPLYPGGDAELLKYIAKSTNYPEVAKKARIEGRVIIRFIVTKEGIADGISILKGVDPLLDEEAVRVVSSLKGFEPGKQGGIPVNVWYMVPINFVLPKDTTGSLQSYRIKTEPGKKPLIVIDGVVTDMDASKTDSKTIESVHVTKGKAATDLYGEKAKDGVISIITKKSEDI